MRSYRPEELFDDGGRLRAELRALRPDGRAAHGSQPARERRPSDARPRAARLPRLRGGRRGARHGGHRGHQRARHLAARRHAGERDRPRTSASSGPTRPRRTVSARSLRGHGPGLDGRAARGRRPPLARRPRDGDSERAPLPGLARGLPADRPSRAVQLLRGVHPHRRLDVQPAREVAEGHARHPVATADRVAELPALVSRLAPGPQRLLAPGPRVHRPRDEQEGGDRPGLPAARRELPAVRGGPLSALARLRQRDRGGQAAVARLPVDRRRDQPLRPGHRHLGLGIHRRRRRAGRRARVRGRRADARDGGRRRAAPRAPPRAARARGQRGRPDAAATTVRAPARPAGRRVRRPLHRFAAGDLRLPRLSRG